MWVELFPFIFTFSYYIYIFFYTYIFHNYVNSAFHNITVDLDCIELFATLFATLLGQCPNL